MKLKPGFITHNMGDEQILIATGKADFSGLVRSNSTAAEIVEALKNETTEDKIVDMLQSKYDAEREVIKDSVDMVIEKLRSIGAIDE